MTARTVSVRPLAGSAADNLTGADVTSEVFFCV